MWLASSIIPAGEAGDGLPRARTVTRTPLNDYAYTQLDELMAELSFWADYWHAAGKGENIYQTGKRVYRRVVSDQPLLAAAEANVYACVILDNWQVIDQHEARDSFHVILDNTIYPMLVRMQGRIVQQKPRKCPNCGAVDVYAQMDDSSALCGSCHRVTYPEKWVTVRDAADILGVSVRAIYNWIKNGDVEPRVQVDARGQRGVSLVRLKECRYARELNEVRQLMGKAKKKK